MKESSQAIAVPPRVLDALERIRCSGLTNMLDRLTVARLADRMGYRDAADWIRAHRREYAEGIFRGFVARDDQKDDA